MTNATITGGAGFLGSHLAEALVKIGQTVTVLDNFSSGLRNNVSSLEPNGVKVIEGDCKNIADVTRAISDSNVVYHFGGLSDVRLATSNPSACYRENVYATHVLLEAMRKTSVKTVVFASTSTVYGDALMIPTPESYSPLTPISMYGSSKLLAERLVASRCDASKKKAIILRMANIVGPRNHHGVISDLTRKLKDFPPRLEVLGDGHQLKSYLHVRDCIQAILFASQNQAGPTEVYNVGSDDQIEVRRIVQILIDEIGFGNVELRFTGGTDGRGWRGDVKNMHLDTTKLKGTGWKPTCTSEESIRLTIRETTAELLSQPVAT